MSDDLIIKISGDIGGLKQSFEDAKSESQKLEDALGTVAKISGAAFAALSAQVVLSVHAFAEAEAASRQLNNTLQNQGIYSEELVKSYGEYAEVVSRTTGIDKAQITTSQAVAQQFLGQIPITEDLTKAIADLAKGQGVSLPEAAAELGKAIGNGTGMLLRQGLQFSHTSTEAERLAKTLEFVTIKYGDSAAEANKGLGSIQGLTNAFHESQVELGQRFAPAVTEVIKSLTNFLTPSKDATGAVVDLKAGFIVAALAVTGLTTAASLGTGAFLVFRAAVAALNIELTATRAILTTLGIGAVIFGVTELALNWESAGHRIIAVVKGLVEFVSGAFKGLSTVLAGAFVLDPDKIKQGLKEIEEAFKSGTKTALEDIPKQTEKSEKEQNEIKKKYADANEAQRRDYEERRKALQKAEDEYIILQLKNSSQVQLELKKQEIEALKALEQNKNKEQSALLRARINQIQVLEEQQIKQDEERDKEFEKTKLDAKKSLDLKLIKADTDLNQKELAMIKSSALTKSEAQKKVYADELKAQIAANNRFLEEQARYGTAYATINQAMRSNEVQGFAQGVSDLTQLTQSKNSTLKEIGKVAAIANIVIQTAQSAMNIYAGFSAIPIIGPELGLAGAAAAVAFGAEKLEAVNAAADGGLVQGGIPGKDSVPFLLEPGELVVPKRNFNDVVGAVSGSGNNNDQVVSLLSSIDSKFSNPQVTNINGDILQDNNFVRSLIYKIKSQIEFNNARIIPVGKA